MQIRTLRKNDFFKLNEMDWEPLPKERDTIYLTIAADQAPCSFIAEEEGRMLGVVLTSRSADGSSIYINHILVDRNTRKGGVGSALMARVEKYAEDNGLKRIWLFCYDELMDYYSARGYSEGYEFLTPEIKEYLRKVKGVHCFVKEHTL